ncbi:MAG: M23 family metallopeptidase [Bacteroidetes bacterium]|nr:M23 family metallopeptidase [Bacteroidota bacterium]
MRVVPPGENRGKSGSALAGTAPQLNLNRAELRAYIESVADIHNERYISLFVVAVSSGGVYHYAYETLNFYPIEEELSKGERELFIYVRPNNTGEGVFHMNVGLIPRTRSAFEDYQRWLLPFHENSTPRQNQSAYQENGKSLNLQFDSTEQTCYFTSEFVNLGDNWWDGFEVVIVEHCVVDSIVDSTDETSGGGICWSCEAGESSGSSNIPPSGCNGDPNAYWDPVCPARCVGGDTDLNRANPGDDCNNLNIPCAGDVVKNPDITSPGNSGKTGGRFKPCVEGVSPGGTSGGWQGPTCTDEDRAVRNGGATQHYGLDLSCSEGEPLYAPFDMDGLETGFVGGYGNFVRGWTTIDGVSYNFGAAHLQAVGRATGSVKRGDIIGYCGRSGITWPSVTTHVHLEMGTALTIVGVDRQNGSHTYYRTKLVDPEPFLATQFSKDTSATPINEDPCGQEQQ